ncbi:MAG: hypothetical protein ACMUHM_07665 [Thermoplasmatota archaeon]
MEKCVILCKLRIEPRKDGDYEQNKTIAIGPFDDHETAGEFMREYLDNEESVRECLKIFYKEELAQFHGWEVADLVMKEYISTEWEGHSRAMRSQQERGPHNY